MITLFAFFLVVLKNALLIYYSGLDSSGYVPRWACIFAGVCFITYNILDNCDGKQARKLKQSTPLGFIFDHNLDSFSCILAIISGSCILGIKSNLELFYLYFMAAVPFFNANWEEYQTGVMNLPAFNGVDEGAFLIFILYVFTGIVGQDFWGWTSVVYGYEITNREALVVFITVCSLIFCIIKYFYFT